MRSRIHFFKYIAVYFIVGIHIIEIFARSGLCAEISRAARSAVFLLMDNPNPAVRGCNLIAYLAAAVLGAIVDEYKLKVGKGLPKNAVKRIPEILFRRRKPAL